MSFNHAAALLLRAVAAAAPAAAAVRASYRQRPVMRHACAHEQCTRNTVSLKLWLSPAILDPCRLIPNFLRPKPIRRRRELEGGTGQIFEVD